MAKLGKGMLSTVEQAFVGRDEKQALLKMPAWEAKSAQERMSEESESPIDDPLPMKIIFNLFLVLCHTAWLF